MAEPLPYAHGKYKAGEVSARRPTLAVIPAEFNCAAARNSDHAVIGAIEAALRRAKIEFARCESRAVASREVALLVRAGDAEAARVIADNIFRARQRIGKPEVSRLPAWLGTGTGYDRSSFLP